MFYTIIFFFLLTIQGQTQKISPPLIQNIESLSKPIQECKEEKIIRPMTADIVYEAEDDWKIESNRLGEGNWYSNVKKQKNRKCRGHCVEHCWSWPWTHISEDKKFFFVSDIFFGLPVSTEERGFFDCGTYQNNEGECSYTLKLCRDVQKMTTSGVKLEFTLPDFPRTHYVAGWDVLWLVDHSKSMDPIKGIVANSFIPKLVEAIVGDCTRVMFNFAFDSDGRASMQTIVSNQEEKMIQAEVCLERKKRLEDVLVKRKSGSGEEKVFETILGFTKELSAKNKEMGTEKRRGLVVVFITDEDDHIQRTHLSDVSSELDQNLRGKPVSVIGFIHKQAHTTKKIMGFMKNSKPFEFLEGNPNQFIVSPIETFLPDLNAHVSSLFKAYDPIYEMTIPQAHRSKIQNATGVPETSSYNPSTGILKTPVKSNKTRKVKIEIPVEK